MTARTEIQVAIRLKQFNGYRYEQNVDYGPGTVAQGPKLTLETAKKQIGLYTKDSEATVVTRKVVIDEGPWEETEMSEMKQLAELLHKKQCHFNHEDMCDWFYGPNTNSHKSYEEKQRKC